MHPGPAFLAQTPADPRLCITRMVVQLPEDGTSEGDLVCFKKKKKKEPDSLGAPELVAVELYLVHQPVGNWLTNPGGVYE